MVSNDRFTHAMTNGQTNHVNTTSKQTRVLDMKSSFDVCESVMFSIEKTETCVLDLHHHTALIDVLQ